MARDRRYVVETDDDEFIEDAPAAARIKFALFKRKGVAVRIWHDGKYIATYTPNPTTTEPKHER